MYNNATWYLLQVCSSHDRYIASHKLFIGLIFIMGYIHIHIHIYIYVDDGFQLRIRNCNDVNEMRGAGGGGGTAGQLDS